MVRNLESEHIHTPGRKSLAALSGYAIPDLTPNRFPNEPREPQEDNLISELLRIGNKNAAMIMGELPLVSRHDHKLFPKGTKLRRVPKEISDQIEDFEKKDIEDWNTPDLFLARLSAKPFLPDDPEARSEVMERYIADNHIVAFDNLRIISPSPEGEKRMSRSGNGSENDNGYPGLLNMGIMGQGRMPLMLGAVPDISSRESYRKAAMSGAMVTASRDKIWGKRENQALLVGTVIQDLKTFPIPKAMQPNIKHLRKFWTLTGNSPEFFNAKTARIQYVDALRNSWIANVGAAIEASKDGVIRAKLLHEVGCKMFRIYSPEGGHEIVETVSALKKEFKDDDSVKIIAGQIMDLYTAKEAVKAGCDSIIIGVAGGSQCTTAKNADIAVNTPNLLYDLRKENLGVPIGIEGGGVGEHMMTAFTLGASFLSKPGEIGVSIAGAGHYVFEDPDGKWYVLYGGEASNSAKEWNKKSFDRQRRIKFPEGEGGIRILSETNGKFDPDDLEDRRSITRNLERIIYSLSVGLVFQRIPTLDMLDITHPRSVSTAAARKSDPYAS